MIDVTRLNGKVFTVNVDHIQTVEETPDTVITLYNGTKFVVKENSEEIKQKVVAFRRSLYADFLK